MKTFGDTRRGQPDDAPMPAFAGHDDEFPSRPIVRFQKRDFSDLLLHLLTLSVPSIEDSRELSSFAKIFRLKKLNDLSCNIHPAGGVDPRCDAKADVIARHVRAT